MFYISTPEDSSFTIHQGFQAVLSLKVEPVGLCGPSEGEPAAEGR